ncbi:DUF732 domain-containing protein [Mycobacterium vicinigordonae]|uniref:DUF732 domain-containing protein n=1 Tax=Mycobacterium vicinigordonae TaxID=1719132 RepID=A0A7D6IND9_9MYCO|nr:DUF732 domain-containing protein [Mycobacterium vicinigordonae]QLL05119.1 DUF732 domain-containing protein [Mycobacterium vicinigordonae]
MTARTLVLTAIVLGALVTAATASADSLDNRFIKLLQSEGISDHISPSHAVEAAHMVCTKLEQGMTPTEVASDVLNSSSMPAYHSGYFVGAAIEVYCPQFEPEEAKN